MVQIILAARGRITTHFHEDIGRGFLHRGIDQGHGDGNAVDLEIRAPADGMITYAAVLGSYGLCYFIRHDDGWVSVLAHHERHLFSTGDRVKQGQLIAVMGNSGTVYVHNHQELRDADANQVDPLLNLVSVVSASTTTAPIPATPAPTIEDYDMTLFYQPTNDSSPDADGVSRIWNGARTISKIEYADVWAVSDIGEGRRLTRRQWVDLNAAAKTRGITLPIIQCTGNDLEQVIFAPRF